MTLRHTPFRRVLNRPILFMQGERELTMCTAIVSGALVVTGQNWVAFVIGSGLWLLSIPLFRWMAQADPQMSKVYFRQLKYKGYYPARSTPYRDAPTPAAVQWLTAVGVVTLFFLVIFWMH